jgi:murein DD-endopeptidase MepM/ murein hydrolase activator NlpD
MVEHGAGWQTVYGHLASLEAQEGDCVPAATIIGKVGATGLTDGPGLHFEVLVDGHHVDPMAIQLDARQP